MGNLPRRFDYSTSALLTRKTPKVRSVVFTPTQNMLYQISLCWNIWFHPLFLGEEAELPVLLLSTGDWYFCVGGVLGNISVTVHLGLSEFCHEHLELFSSCSPCFSPPVSESTPEHPTPFWCRLPSHCLFFLSTLQTQNSIKVGFRYSAESFPPDITDRVRNLVDTLP